MIIDLGGIAKGYTADCMLKVLKAHDLNRSLVDAGGDPLYWEILQEIKGWKVEIQANIQSFQFFIYQIQPLQPQVILNNT